MLNSFARRRSILIAWGLAAVCFGTTTSLPAQLLTRGFDRTAEAIVINEEIVRQPDFWMMEVQIKPMRMVWIDVIDEQTGETGQEQIWYLAWRAIRRPVAGRDQGDTQPVNTLDPLPGPMQFIPQFTLIGYDDPKTEIPAQILPDRILPAAMKAIREIERTDVKNSVTVVRDLPEATPADAENQNWIYGAATWQGVDPRTDFFKVILSGFSNGYELRDAAGDTKQVWRKVIVQRFSRPGDEFDPTQREFQFVGSPEWTFRPDADIPQPPAAE